MPRKVDDDCLRELRWFYDRRELAEVRRDIAAWLAKWQAKYPKLCAWVEENIEETLSYYRPPLPHHKHMKSTNMLERLNQEIKRRTHVVRIFPNTVSCLRLVRALDVEMHENWLEAMRYLNMDHLAEHKKQMLRRVTGAPRLAPQSRSAQPSTPLRAAFSGGPPAYVDRRCARHLSDVRPGHGVIARLILYRLPLTPLERDDVHQQPLCRS